MARLQRAVAIFAFLALTLVGQSALAAGTPPNPSTPTAAPETSAQPPQNAEGGINTLVQPPPDPGLQPADALRTVRSA